MLPDCTASFCIINGFAAQLVVMLRSFETFCFITFCNGCLKTYQIASKKNEIDKNCNCIYFFKENLAMIALVSTNHYARMQIKEVE